MGRTAAIAGPMVPDGLNRELGRWGFLSRIEERDGEQISLPVRRNRRGWMGRDRRRPRWTAPQVIVMLFPV